MTEELQIHGYGFRPDSLDSRDYHYSAPRSVIQTLPPIVDLRTSGFMPNVLDQKSLGSCTANAIANAYRFALAKQGVKRVILPSRLFIYYNERVLENSVNSDAGAEIRDGFKTINEIGICSEKIWKYDIPKFAKKPPQKCYDQAVKHKALQYMRVGQTLNEIKSCLAEGFPIVLGFSVYESFESAYVARTGIASLPAAGEQLLGGHAVLCCGFSDETQTFLCINSWSSDWGEKGFFRLPYAYLTESNLSSDFWTLRIAQ